MPGNAGKSCGLAFVEVLWVILVMWADGHRSRHKMLARKHVGKLKLASQRFLQHSTGHPRQFQLGEADRFIQLL